MRKIILIFNLINLSLALNLFAVDYQDEIKVEGAKFRPMNLAMPKIRADLNASFAKELERIIDLDLDESGVFAILNRKGYLSKSTEGMLKHQIKFSNWRNIGAEGLIKLEVDNQTAKIFVYNLSNLNKFFAREYQINHYSKNFTRVLAHKISDDIFKFFTGEPGVFSTKLAAIKLIENKKQLVLLSADGQVETQLTSRDRLHLRHV